MVPNDWLKSHQGRDFGLILPTGWFGRPFDNRFRIQTFTLTKSQLNLTGTDGWSLSVKSPHLSLTRVEQSDALQIELKGKSSAHFSTNGSTRTQTFKTGRIQLVSYMW